MGCLFIVGLGGKWARRVDWIGGSYKVGCFGIRLRINIGPFGVIIY